MPDPVDSYLGIGKVSNSQSLRDRVTACAARENVSDAPDQWAFTNRWEYGAAPGWAAAYEYSEAGGNPDPGSDPAVITDAMILSQVQAMTSSAPPE